MRINGFAPGVLAEEAKRLGALLVHYSTDYVFDGEKAEPYTEADPHSPLGAYGRSKAAGENAVRTSGCSHLIFRTSWVYAARGRNFLLTILRLAKQKSELVVVNDQHGAPTSARQIATATVLALARGLEKRGPHPRLREGSNGLFHITAGGSTTWFGFAQRILDKATPDVARQGTRLMPIRSKDYTSLAPRPANSALSNDRFERSFGLRLPDWRVGVDLCVAELRELLRIKSTFE